MGSGSWLSHVADADVADADEAARTPGNVVVGDRSSTAARRGSEGPPAGND